MWIGGPFAVAGFGNDFSGANFVNSPSYAVSGSRHRRRSTSTYSSVRRPRAANGTPSASNSSSNQPTPMPSIDAPARQAVECRELLGEDHRVALRQDQDAGRRAGSCFVAAPTNASQINGSGIGDVLTAGHPARRRVRIRRLVAGRHDDVLDRPHRLEAELLGELRHRDRVLGLRPTAPRVGVHEAEFHEPVFSHECGSGSWGDGPRGPRARGAPRQCGARGAVRLACGRQGARVGRRAREGVGRPRRGPPHRVRQRVGVRRAGRHPRGARRVGDPDRAGARRAARRARSSSRWRTTS